MPQASYSRPEDPPAAQPSISLCICTCDRPSFLRRCLASVFAGADIPDQIVVSDDGSDPGSSEKVCAEFFGVHYLRGPGRGMCSNRNYALRHCSGDYIALIDDDVELPPDFVAHSRAIAASDAGRTVYSGDVIEHGTLVPLGDPSFLGHFERAQERHSMVNTNSNLFPRSVVSEAPFDEWIRYGYEELEWGAHLRALGFRIEYRPELVTRHDAPLASESTERRRRRLARRARFYANLKRYLIWEGRPLFAAAFAVLGPLHQAGHHVRRGELRELPGVAFDSWVAAKEVMRQHVAAGRRARSARP
jgi:glycosyltransferase involved in cell wall biosynthesis